jgi:hypothetical protein
MENTARLSCVMLILRLSLPAMSKAIIHEQGEKS